MNRYLSFFDIYVNLLDINKSSIHQNVLLEWNNSEVPAPDPRKPDLQRVPDFFHMLPSWVVKDHGINSEQANITLNLVLDLVIDTMNGEVRAKYNHPLRQWEIDRRDYFKWKKNNANHKDDKEQEDSQGESKNKPSSNILTYLEHLKKSITRWEAGGNKFEIDEKYFQETTLSRKVIPLSGVDLMTALKKEYPDIYNKIGKGKNICDQRFWNAEERRQICILSPVSKRDEAFKKKII